MVDSLKHQDWFIKADKDLKTSQLLYEAGGIEEIVAFHCQQAVKKYMKGFLIIKTGVLHEGHSIIKLLKKCNLYEQDFKNFLEEVAFLNTFYIETRYPSDEPLIVEADEAKKCLEDAEKIVDFIKEVIRKA